MHVPTAYLHVGKFRNTENNYKNNIENNIVSIYHANG